MALLEVDPGTPVDTRGRRAFTGVVTVGALLALGVVAFVALVTEPGLRLDERAMETVVAGRDTQLTVLSVLGRVSIGAVLAVAIVCVLLALVRGEVRLAVAAVTVLLGANLTTQALKRVLLERSDLLDSYPNSLPSGHTTVVVAAVGALCLVSPRALRVAVVPVGAFAVTLTGAATVVAGWHRPADVVAAVLVTLAWTSAAAFVVGGEHRRLPGLWVGALVGSALGVLALVAIGVRPAYGWSGFAEAALVLGALALAVGVLVALMERVSPTRS